MSHKDASLARTRYKRSHRIPARFDDYSEIPPAAQNLLDVTWIERNTEKKEREKKEREEREREEKERQDREREENERQIKELEEKERLNKEREDREREEKEREKREIEEREREREREDKEREEREREERERNDKEGEEKEKRNKEKRKTQDQTCSKSKKSSSCKKMKGSSLMAKKPAVAALLQNTTNTSNINTNNSSRILSSSAQQQQQQQQHHHHHFQTMPRIYNNLAQSMQYGTRLMLNEPIFLPRSVATIAPITTTYQQIAEQARKPPFISKRAEAYLAYQEKRKFDYMISNFKALVKVTSYLELRDLLNLRLVNKSWKSVIDSDTVWNRITVRDQTIIKDWDDFGKTLIKYRTSDLIIDRSKSIILNHDKVYEILTLNGISLKKLTITSDQKNMNRNVLELLCALNSNVESKSTLHILWRVKVIIDSSGRVLVPFEKRRASSFGDLPIDQLLYCYPIFPDWSYGRWDMKTTCIELFEIIDLFNGRRCDKSNTFEDLAKKPLIEIEAI